jgi:hypothetical protein|tara:strand:+ start:1339 stop:1545 length:207 start_codon:yes stop_codon:yes gene_type:complete
MASSTVFVDDNDELAFEEHHVESSIDTSGADYAMQAQIALQVSASAALAPRPCLHSCVQSRPPGVLSH